MKIESTSELTAKDIFDSRTGFVNDLPESRILQLVADAICKTPDKNQVFYCHAYTLEYFAKKDSETSCIMVYGCTREKIYSIAETLDMEFKKRDALRKAENEMI